VVCRWLLVHSGSDPLGLTMAPCQYYYAHFPSLPPLYASMIVHEWLGSFCRWWHNTYTLLVFVSIGGMLWQVMLAPLGTLTRCLVSHASINWMRMKFDMMMCNLQAVKAVIGSYLYFRFWRLNSPFVQKKKVVRCSTFKKISLVICGFSFLLLHLHYVQYNFVLWNGPTDSFTPQHKNFKKQGTYLASSLMTCHLKDNRFLDSKKMCCLLDNHSWRLIKLHWWTNCTHMDILL
jgi:hypothetical protein